MRPLIILVGLGFCWRLWVSWLTPVPSEDGVSYLWMAERFAGGEVRLALSEVFPPLLPMLAAVPTAMGVDPFLSAQVVLCLGGTLSVVAVARASDAMVPGSGVQAAFLLAVAPLPVRFCAEVYTEPLFILFSAMAVAAGSRRRWWSLGAWSGVAFWLRPEALILPLAYMCAGGRGAWRSVIPALGSALALGGWRAALGIEFELVAKLDLILERSIFAPGAGPLDFVRHALQIPWLAVEAWGPVALLAVWGGWRNRRPGTAPLLLALLMAIAVICAFLPRRRFLVAWLPVVVPVAAAGLAAIPRRAWPPVLLGIAVHGIALGLRTTDADRMAERQVGEHLAGLLDPGDVVTGDMTRVVYYAGMRPLVPRRFSSAEIAAAAARPGVRFVVLGSRRETTPAVQESLAARYAPLRLPERLAASAAERGILVLERR